MIHEVITALIPHDPKSTARIVACAGSGSLAYAAAIYRTRRGLKVEPEPKSLADRIRARMAEEPPEIVPMSDALVERIAGVLAPTPAAAEKAAARPASHR